jgi:hypothetical protein
MPGNTGRSVGTVADDEDVLRLSAEPLRRTRWFIPVLINLIAETSVGELRRSLTRNL